MAGFECIAAVERSIERLVNAGFAEADPIPDSTTRARAALGRAEDFGPPGESGSPLQPPALSVFLYRVDFNRTTRAGWSAVGSMDGRAYPPLDLHFLVTPWAQNAEYEMRILGRAMQVLEEHASLSGPLLAASGGWSAGDSVQVVMEELSTEAVMRTFDSLPHDYKLSVPYVARVVRLDGRVAAPDPEVTTALAGVAASAVA